MARWLLVLLILSQLTSCNRRSSTGGRIATRDSVNKPQQKDSFLTSWQRRVMLADELAEHFDHKVRLDSLLDAITHQERVKVLATLTERWDKEEQCYYYSGDGYAFKLKVESDTNVSLFETNTMFYDGKHQVSFRNFQPLCFQKDGLDCEDYGFNRRNTLLAPRIIELCGEHYLYSGISFPCDGIGCGHSIFFIYNTKNHRPVFLENYRIGYEGFLLSDFDADNRPDLLVMMSGNEHKMNGFALDEFEVMLTRFDYNAGLPKVQQDRKRGEIINYYISGISEDYHHSWHLSRPYNIIESNWHP